MNRLTLPILALTLISTAPRAATIGAVNIPDSVYPKPDMGCLAGWLNGSKFPTTLYDPATRERITYNLSRCTGGYISAVNEETSKTWNVDIDSDGNASGRDLAGDSWRYDRKTGLFSNLTTGASCRAANPRQVCD